MANLIRLITTLFLSLPFPFPFVTCFSSLFFPAIYVLCANTFSTSETFFLYCWSGRSGAHYAQSNPILTNNYNLYLFLFDTELSFALVPFSLTLLIIIVSFFYVNKFLFMAHINIILALDLIDCAIILFCGRAECNKL